MSFEEVYKLFLIYTSLSDDDASKYSFFCANAISYLQSQLLDAKLEFDYGERLNVAASALAFFEFSRASTASNNVHSFKAGDITINNTSNLQSANDMWLSEKSKIAFLLKDNDFLFKKV